MPTLPPIIITVIIANILFSFNGFKNPIFFNKYQFQIAKIKAGEQLRMWSSGFLHVDFYHLFVNMFSLYFFAEYVVYSIGDLKFLALYLTSLYVGNYLSYRYHYQQDNYTAVGASGAVSGVVFSAVLLYPEMKMMLLFFSHPFTRLCIGYPLFGLYPLGNEKTKGQYWTYRSFWRSGSRTYRHHSICSKCCCRIRIYTCPTGSNPNRGSFTI